MNQILSKLSLIDSSGNISLTSLALYVCLVKLAISPELGITELGALFLALANYSHKRYATNQAKEKFAIAQPFDESKIEELKSKVNAIVMKMGISGMK